MDGLHSIANEVTITSLPTDIAEKERVSGIMTSGCGCNKRCSQQFSLEYVTSVRASCTELSHSELDMAILGQLMANMNSSSTVSTSARHKESERHKLYTSFDTGWGLAPCVKFYSEYCIMEWRLLQFFVLYTQECSQYFQSWQA